MARSDLQGWSPIYKKCLPLPGINSLDAELAERWEVWHADRKYHLAKNDYRFDALQIYCFGFNIKL